MDQTMWALTFDRTRESWDGSVGMVKERIPRPVLEEPDGEDRSSVIIRVKHAGFCGSDRGIWWRKAFGDMVSQSLDEDGADRRTFGHELLGEIVEVGQAVQGLEPGMRVVFNPVIDEADAIGNGGSQGALSDLVLVRDAVWRNLVVEPWRRGDVVAIDNHSTSHGRLPYEGARHVAVCWA